jgi:purine-nucleoside phosphorylase
MKVAGLSCICNWAAGISPAKLTHEEVNQTAAIAMPRMKNTITTFIKEIACAD